jgi:sugar/nucleoside kinase (ribokinase family)
MLKGTVEGRTAAVFIGDVAFDEYFRADYWPQRGDKLDVDFIEATIGGMIANAACRYAGYGAATQLVTGLNSGAASDQLVQHLRAAGVGTDHMVREPGLADSRTLVLLVEGEHTVFIPRLGDYQVTVGPALLSALQSAAFVYSTVAELTRLRGIDGRSGPRLLDAVRQGGTPIVLDLDVGSAALLGESYLPLADVVLVNELGFRRLRGDDSEEVASARLHWQGTQLVAVTRGAAGCTFFTPDERLDIEGIPVEVVDATGAGDAFGASLMYALSQGWDLHRAGTFANAVGARTVSVFGPQGGVGPADDVLAWLDAHHS